MKVSQIASPSNLMLAWRRITTGANAQYKRYFRQIYESYEVALDKNLKDLRLRLVGGSFQPQSSFRLYLPKATGLHRPLSVLHLEDQIVIQAIANIMARRLHGRRRPLQRKHVFSNILQRDDSIFFFQNWRSTYSAFTRRIQKHFASGRKWVADFDLAAFYDTISHDLLLRTAYPKSLEQDDVKLVLGWLRAWTAEGPRSSHGHGLPQGPIASDFLAECFLLPIDEKLAETVTYVRYVDDIRLFGRTEGEVRESVIKLEILCQERGLIPQVGKFEIKKVTTAREAVGMLPSITAPDDHESGNTMPEATALMWLRTALTKDEKQIIDKTRARYVLYRVGPARRILDIVLRLLPSHPEHIDTFVYHLSQYPRSRRVASMARKMLTASPYEYVRGEMWHFLALHFTQLTSDEIYALLEIAVENAKKSSGKGLSLRWGACHFLCEADKAGMGAYRNFLKYQPQLLQALSVPFLPDAAYANDGIVRDFLRRSSFEAGITLAPFLAAKGRKPQDYGVSETELPSQTLNVFVEWGLAKGKAKRVDAMGEILSARYGVIQWNQWKSFLGPDYANALGLLRQADVLFDSGRSHWLNYQNSFNQVMFVQLQKYLQKMGLPGSVATTESTGKMKKYGVTLDPSNAFSSAYPTIADAFREMNRRRNELPGSHPYDEKTAAQTHPLKTQERNRFVNKLRIAYAALHALVS